jgi:hypothetical protein
MEDSHNSRHDVCNFLFYNGLDLASELRLGLFAIYITREIEIEASAIPDRDLKKALKEYMAYTIAACGIKTTRVFGLLMKGRTCNGTGASIWAFGSLRPNKSSMLRSQNAFS